MQPLVIFFHSGWYFDEQDAIRKRFTPRKWVPDFDEVFEMEGSISTVQQHDDH